MSRNLCLILALSLAPLRPLVARLITSRAKRVNTKRATRRGKDEKLYLNYVFLPQFLPLSFILSQQNWCSSRKVEHLVPIASQATFIMTAKAERGWKSCFFVAFQQAIKKLLQDFGCRGESKRIMQIGALCWLRSALIENCTMIRCGATRR